ncbi:MAG: 50S ribosomal protein L24 [Candidatus Anstonellales archaeon]
MGSTRARKSRKAMLNAPLHKKRALLHAGLSEDLAKKLGTRRRTIPVRKGDTIKILSGSRADTVGKVISVDVKNTAVYVEGITKKNSRGIEKLVPLHPSSLQIIDGDFSGWRKKIIER